MKGFLVIFHTPSNAGYAMSALEKTFYDVALQLTQSEEHVHFAFKDLASGPPKSLPQGFSNLLEIDTAKIPKNDKEINDYIKLNRISTVLCFDIQPNASLCKIVRAAGVQHIVSYWGAAMSSLNSGLKLLAKKVEVSLYRNKPDLFIFESNSMLDHAVNGRGINKKDTVLIPTGVDTEKYTPNKKSTDYLHDEFGIPPNAFVVFYSGHMEERKGVSVIMRAAHLLIHEKNYTDIFFVICGNRPGEEAPFYDSLKESRAKGNVIFAGYRNDLDLIMPNCSVGTIASTGWDSFPMSSLEMAASGLPLVVSDLQGLSETIVDHKTGYLFEPGSHEELAKKIESLYLQEDLRQALSAAGRLRIEKNYTVKLQKEKLVHAISKSAGA